MCCGGESADGEVEDRGADVALEFAGEGVGGEFGQRVSSFGEAGVAEWWWEVGVRWDLLAGRRVRESGAVAGTRELLTVGRDGTTLALSTYDPTTTTWSGLASPFEEPVGRPSAIGTRTGAVVAAPVCSGDSTELDCSAVGVRIAEWDSGARTWRAVEVPDEIARFATPDPSVSLTFVGAFDGPGVLVSIQGRMLEVVDGHAMVEDLDTVEGSLICSIGDRVFSIVTRSVDLDPVPLDVVDQHGDHLLVDQAATNSLEPRTAVCTQRSIVVGPTGTGGSQVWEFVPGDGAERYLATAAMALRSASGGDDRPTVIGVDLRDGGNDPAEGHGAVGRLANGRVEIVAQHDGSPESLLDLPDGVVVAWRSATDSTLSFTDLG